MASSVPTSYSQASSNSKATSIRLLNPKSLSTNTVDPLSYTDDPQNGSIAMIILNRPKAANTFNADMHNELIEAFGWFDRDHRVKVVVLTGAGKMFCAGADLVGGWPRESRPPDHIDGGGRVALAIQRCRKPIIAAINGPAVGVGITMTLSATIRLTSPNAKIAFPFNRRGIAPEATSTYLLPKLIGLSSALYLFTTGITLPANAPQLNGLFAEFVDRGEMVLKRGLELASDIATNTSLISNAVTKDLVLYSNPQNSVEAHINESRALGYLFQGTDVAEGSKSFFEKRSPDFKGKLDNDITDSLVRPVRSRL